jgi:hypothetical protein
MGINAHLSRSAVQVADSLDRIASGPNVALVPGVAGPIDNVGILNQNVEWLDLKKKA